jgi:hypothetical protein
VPAVLVVAAVICGAAAEAESCWVLACMAANAAPPVPATLATVIPVIHALVIMFFHSYSADELWLDGQ